MKTKNLRTLLCAVVIAGLGVVALGCNTAHLSQLRDAASQDLNCSKGRVDIITRSGKTRDVEACGQRATYRWEDGDWRMISRSGAPAPKAGGPPPVAPAQPAPAGGLPPSSPTGTPSQPPPSSPAPGGKSL